MSHAWRQLSAMTTTSLHNNRAQDTCHLRSHIPITTNKMTTTITSTCPTTQNGHLDRWMMNEEDGGLKTHVLSGCNTSWSYGKFHYFLFLLTIIVYRHHISTQWHEKGLNDGLYHHSGPTTYIQDWEQPWTATCRSNHAQTVTRSVLSSPFSFPYLFPFLAYLSPCLVWYYYLF